MSKWNKKDTRFILTSLIVSGLSIFIWYLFHASQINTDYLHFSFSEKDAKLKAQKYISSRGWDISNHKYASKYIQKSLGWGDSNANYFSEKLANKKKTDIEKINTLGGNHRWRLRWFKENEIDQIHIAYTKNGQLTYFERELADSLTGSSISQDIAYNIAKIFLKNMPSNEMPGISNFIEDDWNIIEKSETEQENRTDHYFKLEHKHHDFNGTKIRMSVKIFGNEVMRYHRWIEETEELKQEFSNFSVLNGFSNRTAMGIIQFGAFISILIGLFYFKIPSNWKLASQFGMMLVISQLLFHILQMPVQMINYGTEDTIIAHVLGFIVATILNSSFAGFFGMIIMVAIDKLYRKSFPHFISIKNMFLFKSFTSKAYFNTYFIGIISSLVILAFSGIFYHLIDQSGHYIAYKYFNHNIMLSLNPLLSIMSITLLEGLMIFAAIAMITLILYQGLKNKWLTIFMVSLLFSFGHGPTLINVEPVILGAIYFFILTFIFSYLLLHHGMVSFAIAIISIRLIEQIILLIFIGQASALFTAILLIMLLIFPLIYSILHYLKYQHTTPGNHLLNSANPVPNVTTFVPSSPKLEKITDKKWAFGLLLIGFACLFVPNNDELKDLFKFNMSKSEAIESAKKILETDYKANVSNHEVTTNNWDSFQWQSWTNELPPFYFHMNKRSHRLAYLKQTVGRKGIAELQEEHGNIFVPWNVIFYKPNLIDRYILTIKSDGSGQSDFFDHRISNTVEMPSMDVIASKKMAFDLFNKRGIDINSLKLIETNTIEEKARTDHEITFERTLSLKDENTINERIFTKISGNKISNYEKWFDRSEIWNRNFHEFHPLFLFCTWGSLLLWIMSMVIGLYYLIENSYQHKKEISWSFLIGFISLITFLSISHYLNNMPNMVGTYYGYQTWQAFILDKISWMINDTSMLFIFIIIPISSLYLINPEIKKIFSKKLITSHGKTMAISMLATTGAVLTFRPIKYLLYENFPYFMTLDGFNHNDLSAHVPGYQLILTPMIETLWLAIISLFFYQKIMELKEDGKSLKANLLIGCGIIFYLIYGTFIEQQSEMLPHFLYRGVGVIFYFALIKYFWKNNPLSHLFGSFIYFQFHKITSFINIADPSIKYQGWIIIGLFILLVIYCSGIKSIKDSFSSKTA